MPSWQNVRLTNVSRDAARLSAESRTEVAALVYAAGREFYDCFDMDRHRLLDTIAAQVIRPGTEVGRTHALWVGEHVVGIASTLAMERLRGAQAFSTALLLHGLAPSERQPATERVGAYSAAVEPVGSEGVYLARLAVGPQCQGEGLGRLLLSWVCDTFGDQRLTLHVDRANQRAIGLYEQCGFVRSSDGDFRIRAYVRQPGTQAG